MTSRPQLPRRLRLCIGACLLAAAVAGCAPSVLAPTAAPASTSAPAPASPSTSSGVSSAPAVTSAPASSSAPDPASTSAPASAGVTTAPSSPAATTSVPAGDPSAVLAGTSHNAAASAHAYPAKDVLAWLEGDVKPTEKVVFLTFDDGPNHVITPVILDELKEAGVPATFYVVGNVIDDAPDVIQRTITEGHSIAIHSWSHDYAKLYPGRTGNTGRIVEEYDRTLAALRTILGPGFTAHAWRYPGGHMSWKGLAGADKALAAKGVYWQDWNAMTGDAEPKKRRPTTVSGMVEMATAPISQGFKVAVVLAHDTPGKDLTAKSLPKIIAAYKEAGFSFGVIA